MSNQDGVTADKMESEHRAEATRMAGAPYQSRLMPESTRLGEVGYQSRLATAEEKLSPERYAIGDVIGGRYEVLAIHRGTMGVVYATFARETKLPRALKTLQHRFAANATMRDLFAAEATTWVTLEKHPFIVRAHLVELFDYQPYVVTEYIQGREGMTGDLRGWLGHPRLTLPVAAEMALQIAQGMQHATRKVPGLVHRDLKPANILVDERGHAMVTDFGLAHAAQADAGTPAYMAPEQWRGEELDQRADLYAFGCIFHEMLTGRRLFAAVSLDDWRNAHLFQVPVTPRKLKPELPAGLDELVRRCLAKERSARPAGWDAVVSVCAGAFHEITGQPVVLDFSAYELSAGELVTASHSLLVLGKNQEALDASNRAVEIDPRVAGTWFMKGVALESLKRYDEAIACFDHALEIDPRNASNWSRKAGALEKLTRYDEAIACFDRALAIDPSAQNWVTKGDALESLTRYDEAIACYDRALEIDPGYGMAWNNKAVVFWALARDDEAIACIRRCAEIEIARSDCALEIDPRDAKAWLNKGISLDELKRHDEASACYEHALEVEPRNAMAWSQKGNALAHLKQYDEAIACYEHALAINSLQGMTRLNLDRIRRGLGPL